ncbi:hypothetical protein MPSEU_000156000 [Mayamaea pseudoterrestris]|nr:hypothetical protein MPSEU_000156000 [Mayamaea pseudoterrestris]
MYMASSRSNGVAAATADAVPMEQVEQEIKSFSTSPTKQQISSASASSSSSHQSKRAWISLIVTLGTLSSFNRSFKALEALSPSSSMLDWSNFEDMVPSRANNRSIMEEVQRRMFAKSEPLKAEDVDKKHEPLNIVLFYADDWTMKTLGLVNPHVHTPNIDGMAKRGMFFPRNAVTTSICWQSRATMMTGMTSAVHQALKIISTSMYNGTVPWHETLYPLLKSHGHHVGYVGKYHNSYDKNAFAAAFSWFKFYFGHHFMGKQHVTQQNAQDALWYLRSGRPQNQSFALTIAFFATHAQDGAPFEKQFEPQQQTEYLYENKTIPMPKTATEKHWNAMPWFFTEANEARNRWRVRFDTYDRHQYTIKRLYRMASEVDDVVGQVINELKAQNVYEKTMLVFTTDNGMFHGEHGLADKWYPHEESIRVPLVIEDPRMPMHLRGTVNNEITLNVDLAPTLLTAAGIQPPSFMQGRDISQLYLNATEATKTWRQDFFYEWNQGEPQNATGHGRDDTIPAVFALVGKEYKYFYWPAAAYEQLFNISQDPWEENDVFKLLALSEPNLMAKVKKRYEFMKAASQGGLPV